MAIGEPLCVLVCHIATVYIRQNQHSSILQWSTYSLHQIEPALVNTTVEAQSRFSSPFYYFHSFSLIHLQSPSRTAPMQIMSSVHTFCLIVSVTYLPQSMPRKVVDSVLSVVNVALTLHPLMTVIQIKYTTGRVSSRINSSLFE